MRVGKGLLAAALVAGPIRCPRASHGGSYGLHGLWRKFAKLAFGGRDRTRSWLTVHRGRRALRRGRPPAGRRLKLSVDLRLHLVDRLRAGPAKPGSVESASAAATSAIICCIPRPAWTLSALPPKADDHGKRPLAAFHGSTPLTTSLERRRRLSLKCSISASAATPPQRAFIGDVCLALPGDYLPLI